MVETEPEGEISGSTLANSPNVLEIFLPPCVLLFVIIFGCFMLALRNHGPKWWASICAICRRKASVDMQLVNRRRASRAAREEKSEESGSFFSPFDLEALDGLNTYYNRASELCKIALPSLLSLAVCPFTMYLFEPMARQMWTVEDFPTLPNINEAIGCYLAPAGLVYATSFGFAFQQALHKQAEILNKMTHEISMLDQMATMTSLLSVSAAKSRLTILKAIKAETIFMCLQIQDKDPNNMKSKAVENVKVKIWDVISMLRRAIPSDNRHFIDRVVCENIIGYIMSLNSITSDRMGIMHARIHPIKWAFLLSLGYFSFFGVLMLQTESYRMNLCMSIITVFSISMLCFVVSDFDSPFSGFFRVDMSILADVALRLSNMYKMEQQEGDTLVEYPLPEPTTVVLKKLHQS